MAMAQTPYMVFRFTLLTEIVLSMYYVLAGKLWAGLGFFYLCVVRTIATSWCLAISG